MFEWRSHATRHGHFDVLSIAGMPQIEVSQGDQG